MAPNFSRIRGRRMQKSWRVVSPASRFRGTRGARLACEAVVSKDNRATVRALVCALLCLQELGSAVSPERDIPRPGLLRNYRAQGRKWVCLMTSPCSPRPRKRGTLHSRSLIGSTFLCDLCDLLRLFSILLFSWRLGVRFRFCLPLTIDAV